MYYFFFSHFFSKQIYCYNLWLKFGSQGTFFVHSGCPKRRTLGLEGKKYLKLQVEITKNLEFWGWIRKNFKKKIRSFEAGIENILRSLSLNPISRLLIKKTQCMCLCAAYMRETFLGSCQWHLAKDSFEKLEKNITILCNWVRLLLPGPHIFDFSYTTHAFSPLEKVAI